MEAMIEHHGGIVRDPRLKCFALEVRLLPAPEKHLYPAPRDMYNIKSIYTFMKTIELCQDQQIHIVD